MSSQLDQGQIIQKVYNESNESLNVTVDSVVEVATGIVEVAVDQSTDSIRIGDGTNLVTTTNVGGKQGLDVNVIDNITLNQPVAVTQSGTWNINTISSLPLPAGASTSAIQTTQLTTLNNINAKLVNGNDIGDVTINNASGASAVNIQDGGNSITIDGTVTSNIGTTGGLALDTTSSSIDSKLTTTNTSLNSIDGKIPSGLTVQNNKLLTNSEFDAVYFVENFLNGSSKSMSVDGSVTPVTFSYAPLSGQTYIKEVSFFILDAGSSDPNKFGNVPILTNGLQLQIKSKGIVYDIVNIQDNIDIVNVFTDAPLLPGSTNGFLSSNDLYSGNLIYDHPVVLDSALGDYISFIVQDDLSTVQVLRATAKIRINT